MFGKVIVVLVSLVFVQLLPLATSDLNYDYGIVCDGGSTHTGLYIYRWPQRVSHNTTAPDSIPEQVTFTSKKPGISTCCSSYSQMVSYFEPLIAFAKNALENQSAYWNTYPFYIKATAGMRVLPEPERLSIMYWIRALLSNETINPFSFVNDQAVILSGEEEGSFGWLSVNLIFNRLSSNTPGYEMFGAMDMGGQSTQISYAALPSSDILEECTVIHLFNTNFRVYSHSYLTYGMNSMYSQVQQLLYNEQAPQSQQDKVIWNPCLLSGFNDTTTVLNSSDQLVEVAEKGQGLAHLCGAYIRELFFNGTRCVTGSCGILGIYQPYNNINNITFYAFSNYAYTLSDLNLSNTSSLAVLNTTAQEICSLTWQEFPKSKWGLLINATGNWGFASQYCFQLCYIFNILHHAYQFPLDSTNIVFTNAIEGTQLGWTQGSMLRDANWLPFRLATKETTSGAADCFWQLTVGTMLGLLFVFYV